MSQILESPIKLWVKLFSYNSGAITKFVPVTVDGKNKFGDFPKISSELKSIASKVKVYAAWSAPITAIFAEGQANKKFES